MPCMCKTGNIDRAKIVSRACHIDTMQELPGPSQCSMDQYTAHIAIWRVLCVANLPPDLPTFINCFGAILGRHHVCDFGEVDPSGSQMNVCNLFLNTGYFRGKSSSVNMGH